MVQNCNKIINKIFFFNFLINQLIYDFIIAKRFYVAILFLIPYESKSDVGLVLSQGLFFGLLQQIELHPISCQCPLINYLDSTNLLLHYLI